MQHLSRLSLIAFFPIVGMLTSCGAKTFNTGILESKSNKAFYQIELDLYKSQMDSNGFSYGDIVKVDVKKDNFERTFTIPYVTNYNEAGTFGPCLCNYGGSTKYNINIAPGLNGELIQQANYFEGGTATISMAKKGGYSNKRNLISVPTKMTYEECGRDNLKFSNCRDVTSVGNIKDHIQPGILFRGSSPICNSKNKERYKYADEFLKENKIQYDISLSLEEKDLKEIYEKETTVGEYTKSLYNSSKLMTVSLGGDYFQTTKDGNDKLGGDYTCDVFKYIADESKTGPFFIHCNEGKDRTGFILMVLEALMGVSLEDLEADFMLTFNNYFNISKVNNLEKYNTMANVTFYRNIYAILIDAVDGNDRYKKLGDTFNMDFDATTEVNKLIQAHPDADYIQNCAKKYLNDIGAEEAIKKIITKLKPTSSLN